MLGRLHEAGFTDVTGSTFPLFYYPAPRGVRPAELVDKMGISKQLVNNILVAMEAAGYVERRKEPGGRGRRLVWLTERGEQLSQELLRISQEMEAEIVDRIGARAHAGLVDHLRGLAQQFG
jgi:DNA-binding MarR family transcriptional regulator